MESIQNVKDHSLRNAPARANVKVLLQTSFYFIFGELKQLPDLYLEAGTVHLPMVTETCCTGSWNTPFHFSLVHQHLLSAQECPYVLHPVSQEFPPIFALQTMFVRLTIALSQTDDCTISSSQGRLSTAAYFYTLLLQTIDAVTVCPWFLPAGSVNIQKTCAVRPSFPKENSCWIWLID